jgi:hypothetical protein
MAVLQNTNSRFLTRRCAQVRNDDVAVVCGRTEIAIVK